MARPVAGFLTVDRLCRAWTVVVLAFLYLPILVLVLFSFEPTGSTTHLTGFTVRWYVELWRDGSIRTAAGNSLIVAAVTALLSTALGTAAAWLGHRYTFRLGPVPVGRPVLSLAAVPIVMPDVVIGVSLLVLFSVMFRTGPADRVNAWFAAHGHDGPLQLGYATLVLAHVTFCFPFVMVAVRARLAGLDPSLEEAARDLGASPAGAFARVVLPYLFPAVIAGGLMAFTLSLDELIVSSYTRGTVETLPTKVYGLARLPLRPTLNAVSTVFVAFTVVVMVIADRLRRTPAEEPA